MFGLCVFCILMLLLYIVLFVYVLMLFTRLMIIYLLYCWVWCFVNCYDVVNLLCIYLGLQMFYYWFGGLELCVVVLVFVY